MGEERGIYNIQKNTKKKTDGFEVLLKSFFDY